MELKELLKKAREFNGMIITPEDLLNHLQRVQTCSNCGLDYHDKICPECRDKLNPPTKPKPKKSWGRSYGYDTPTKPKK